MKIQFEVKIPKPCSADWNLMKPNQIGKHCDSCNKTVVDFTKMTDTEIKSYFLYNTNKKTCGHFYKGQLELNKNKIQSYFYNLYCDTYINLKYKSTRIVILFLISCMLTIVGCTTPTTGEIEARTEHITGDSIGLQIDTTNIDSLKNGL